MSVHKADAIFQLFTLAVVTLLTAATLQAASRFV